MTPRRELTLVVLGCAVAAGLVLLGTGRDWLVEVVPRPAPMPDLVQRRTGGELRAWLPALGWVALAAAGALLATRGLARRLVGVVLGLAGAGVAAGAATLLAREQVGPGWPLVVTVAGLLLAAAGVLVVWRGAGWPAMGARYQRTAAPARVGGRDPGGANPGGRGPGGPDRPEDLWEALERGEDPTTGPEEPGPGR